MSADVATRDPVPRAMVYRVDTRTRIGPASVVLAEFITRHE